MLANWYELIVAEGVDLDLPGIYEWQIEGAGSYIGRYTYRSRPLVEYEANVLKIIEGRPYRPRKPNGFRPVHRALELAIREGRKIRLVILENCPASLLSDRERELIAERGKLNGRQRAPSVETVELGIAARVDLIVRAEPKLNSWTSYAVHGLSLFEGANDALQAKLDPDGDMSQLAAWYREEVAILTALRVHSLFDRSAEVSFQRVNQHLNVPGVRDALASHYIGDNPSAPTWLPFDCTDAIDRFLARYQAIDLDALGNLQHFRNFNIAHIAYKDAERFITFGELRSFVHLAADLSAELSMMVRGLNREYRQRLQDQAVFIEASWRDAIRLAREADEPLR